MTSTYLIIIAIVALALVVWLLLGRGSAKPPLPKDDKPRIEPKAPDVPAPAAPPEALPVTPAPASVIAEPELPEMAPVPAPPPPKPAAKPKAAAPPKAKAPAAPKAKPPAPKKAAAPKAAAKPVAKTAAAKPKAEPKPKAAPKAAPKPKAVANAAPAPAPSAPPAPPPMTAIGVPGAVGAPDNLLLVKGLGPKLNTLLTGLGITRFDQIAAWSADDVARVDEHLGAFTGRIGRDNWIEQAGLLATGKIAEFEAKFGKLDSENR